MSASVENAAVSDALRPGESGLQLIVDNIPGLVYTMTPQCQLEMVNRQVLEYFGLPFDELARWDMVGCVHPDDLPRVRESLQRTVQHAEPHEVEQRLRRADGLYRWFKPRTTPLRAGDGQVLRWYCLLTDIDDLKRAEESLRATQSRLARAANLATVSELSASIAHEINQPLAAVVANAQACRQWLSAGPPNLERALRSAELVVRDANSAAEVVHRVRSLFRRAPPVKHVLDVNEVIAEVVGLMSDDLRNRQVEVVLELQLGGAAASADRVQLQQILVNMMRNAIEAVEAVADRPRRLTLVSQVHEPELRVMVRDNGIGVASEASVFESFYSTKPQGFGIGLAICRSVVEAHEGRIWVTRLQPCGSEFGFALPLQARGAE